MPYSKQYTGPPSHNSCDKYISKQVKDTLKTSYGRYKKANVLIQGLHKYLAHNDFIVIKFTKIIFIKYAEKYYHHGFL